ncbi:MAG: hypothetical protein ACYC7E_17320 [Armatimonadota bacterium]
MRRTSLLYIVAMLAGMLFAVPAHSASDIDRQREVSQKFLKAFLTRDMDAVRDVVPTKPQHLFGPYLFNETLKLNGPKVDDDEAAIDFTANVGDSRYPRQGAFLLKKHNNTWYMRHVFFFDKIPIYLQLPRKSVTPADQKQEPRVKEAATDFLAAWKRNDCGTMHDLWYNWTKYNKPRRNNFYMSNLSLTTTKNVWKDVYIKYSAKLSYKWGLLSYSVNFNGGLTMVEENGDWKVRPLTLIFDF